MTTTLPLWLQDAKEESRNFSGVNMDGWVGNVQVMDITYWIKNRRTDILVSKLKDGGLNCAPKAGHKNHVSQTISVTPDCAYH